MSDQAETGSTIQTCPLSWPEQRRNLILFAGCTSMQYLAAPVLYVGITQASLCDRLGASARTANLPSTLFFAMTAIPALIAWLSPKVSSLKRNLSLCYTASAVMLATISICLSLPISDDIKIAVVVLQGAVTGAVMPLAIALLWEAIGRGVDEAHRGLAMSLGFGFGPIMAVLGSLAQTALLGGKLFGFEFEGASYPNKFVILFGAGAPIMLLVAILGQFLVIPRVETEPERAPLSSVVGLAIGLPSMLMAVAMMQLATAWDQPGLRYLGYLSTIISAAGFMYHFRELLSQPVLLTATLVTVLIYSGNVIPSNMNLYSHNVLGNRPEDWAGIENVLRFSFKVVAGLLLGWLLTRTNPRTGVVATATIYLAGQIWALLVTGPWYLLAFGIHGAGELVGVYAPNYFVSASRPADLRRNTAFMTMLMVPAAPAGYLFGALVDYSVSVAKWSPWGMNSSTFGFRLSFLTCGVFILLGIILAIARLPANPKVSST